MNLKQLLPLLFLTISSFLIAQEPAEFKLYGFIRNDFYYNSRQNVEAIDGLFHLFPKPVSLDAANKDINATPLSEMLSVATRLGLDINGSEILGAKSSAKIEADFAGFSSNFYVLRIRQAYAKLNWTKSELLVGQTWHPLFGSVMPTSPSYNAGTPFQPFNRSPQVRFKQNMNSEFSFLMAASYQMQYVSQGPIGSSANYSKSALLPSLFVGAESKTKFWTSGMGADVKTIKPSVEKITSVSAVAYTQFVNTNFQFKAKALWGENLSDHLMLSGYGVTDSINGNPGYTNFNIVSSWLNIVYGTKWQAGIFVGFSKNLGTNKTLVANADNKFTAYGYGFYQDNQLLLDRLIRLAPHISYNLPNLKFGLEYDLTSASYGTLKSNGLVATPYSINNHRIVASACYFF
jgi:hypothetical protein